MRYAILIALVTASIAAQPKPACTEAEYRQFDFWVGEWTVQNPKGKLAGTNSISKIGNCALLEQWSGNGGMTGKSLNSYDAERKLWHQTWVDTTGGILYLDGSFQNGSMVLSGKSAGTMDRITWTPLKNGDVRQLWEQSKDSGKTWAVVFDGRYMKKTQ